MRSCGCVPPPVPGLYAPRRTKPPRRTDSPRPATAATAPPLLQGYTMFSVRCGPPAFAFGLERAAITHPSKFSTLVVCGARGPRPRYPRVWKTRKRIGTVSKSQKLVECVKGLSNVKEEVYGALDSFVAWELEFPLIAVKKALKTLEDEKEWKRIIQVIKWMFNKGQGKTMGSYYTLLNALIEDGRVEEAEELYGKIFSRYLEGLPRTFFMRMISLYYRLESYQKMFEIFADMEELGVRPDGSIIRMLGEVFQKLGMLDKYVKLKKKYPPPKWEYRHIKGKRIRVKVYPKDEIEEPMRNPGTDEVEEEENMDVDSELEEAASAGLDRNVLDEAACGDLEFV